ncbi:MAG: pyridoxine 5'-phosphate synthase [Proteobacteria bacterium]|nr:pyridoxine 5'-phosphate synthase [Pseudomonadota bacterium]
MVKLGVNIDHVATLREARKTSYPDPIHAAVLAELGGADGITVHLREDRRHIKERDLKILKEIVKTRLNLEMAGTKEMVEIALQVKPHMVTLVPEKREELTTEGGLDVKNHFVNLKKICSKLKSGGIKVFIFVDPDEEQIEKCYELGVNGIEIHTGKYADALSEEERDREFLKIKKCVLFSLDRKLKTSAGHGLNYENVQKIAGIPGLYELNIGHSIVSRSIFVGMKEAVREMKNLIITAKETGL